MKEDTYQPRTYRHWIEGKDLVSFQVTVKETNLYIRAASNLQRKAQKAVIKYREQLEKYIGKNPAFKESLEPLPIDDNAPHVVKMMLEAGEEAGVGPMAAVAGAIAECVGKELLEYSPEVIVENGGDIFLKSLKKRVVGIYAGESLLSGKIGLEIDPKDTPLGVCTSSGTVGHSLSYGKADAMVVVASSATLADAAATAIGNRVKKADDITTAIVFGGDINGIKGLVIIKGDTIGVHGDISLCQIAR
ncbi:MAG TPA: UPF0280 family protein [Dehalococcoidia bacterium]|nr:UPF0280 family protein [Dehalococcoidia bacterium]